MVDDLSFAPLGETPERDGINAERCIGQALDLARPRARPLV
jgi:hypothetical protein